MDKTIDHRLAWLAGIIDGEGCIGAGVRRQLYKGQPRESVDWWVRITNTDPSMLNEVMAICDILAVRYSHYLHQAANARCREQHSVSVNSKIAVRALLLAVLPFLVNKRGHAELILRAMHYRYGSENINARNGPWCRNGRQVIRVSDDAPLVEMLADIKAVNRRGPRPQAG